LADPAEASKEEANSGQAVKDFDRLLKIYYFDQSLGNVSSPGPGEGGDRRDNRGNHEL